MRILVCVVLIALVRCTAAAAEPFVVVVRHAEKASKGGNDPDLTPAGKKRADALAAMLKDSQIVAIFTSEFKRTQETAAPAAKMFGITPTTVSGVDTAALVAKLRRLKGNALVVGHTNTIPDLVRVLGIDASIHIPETDYGSIFVVTLGHKPQLLRLRYEH